MTKINDGGPAFPRPEERDGDGCGLREGSDGMSLRDWFAGQALTGIIADGFVDYENAGWEQRISSSAFFIADAMLKAREAKP